LLVFMRLHWRVEPYVAWLAGRRVKLRWVIRVLPVPPVHRERRGAVCVVSGCRGVCCGSLLWVSAGGSAGGSAVGVCGKSAPGLPAAGPVPAKNFAGAYRRWI